MFFKVLLYFDIGTVSNRHVDTKVERPERVNICFGTMAVSISLSYCTVLYSSYDIIFQLVTNKKLFTCLTNSIIRYYPFF